MGALVKTLGKKPGTNQYRYPKDVANAKSKAYRDRLKAGMPPTHARTPRTLEDRECKACGKTFRPLLHRVWCCSKVCAGHLAASTRGYSKSSPVYFYVCASCGLVRTCRHPSQKTCSPACALKYQQTMARAYSEAHDWRNREPRACMECGGAFTPVYGDKRRSYCSARCSKKKLRREHGKSGPARARRKGVKTEAVQVTRVFERDGWRCQVCGKSTPKERRGTRYPNAPELDHRVPIALGGSHTYGNVQCACRACNNAKGGHTVAGQLPLLEAT